MISKVHDRRDITAHHKVGVLPVGDPKDDHNQPVIPNCVDNPTVADANPVEVV